ncbi:MAG: alpha/beta fold hydrolase [Acidimicrobiales bacterium]
MTDIMPGAEPMSVNGGPTGVLAIHGFTGSPQSMRPIASAMAAAGHSVELPLLPGHGTTVDDMLATGWSDWTAAVDAAYRDLAARTERVVVTGLSMGGALTLWLATQHPEIAAIIPINAAGKADPDLMEGLQAFIDSGATVIDAIGGDIAKDGVVEVAYDQTPLAPLLSLQQGILDMSGEFSKIAMPTLLITSRNDHVVSPDTSDFIAEQIGSDPERLWLDDSFHVATLDHDAQRIIDAVASMIADLDV